MNESKLFFVIFFIVSVSTSGFASDAVSLLPKNNDIKGWMRTGEPRLFENSKLWEYIDGGADAYIDYGFQRVATVELKNGKSTIVVDVYDMKTLEGAFGIYARERAPTYHFIKIGAEGYQEGVALNFYQDKFYIKLIAYTDDAQTRQTLTQIAQFISKKIVGAKKQPSTLSLFPQKGKDSHTELYEVKNYLGETALRETYSARYILNGKKFTLFMCDTKSESSAKVRFQSLRSSLTNVGSFDKQMQGFGDAVLTGKHREAKEIVMIQKGKYIVGLHPFVDDGAVKEFLKSFTNKLK